VTICSSVLGHDAVNHAALSMFGSPSPRFDGLTVTAGGLYRHPAERRRIMEVNEREQQQQQLYGFVAEVSTYVECCSLTMSSDAANFSLCTPDIIIYSSEDSVRISIKPLMKIHLSSKMQRCYEQRENCRQVVPNNSFTTRPVFYTNVVIQPMLSHSRKSPCEANLITRLIPQHRKRMPINRPIPREALDPIRLAVRRYG
jgi:hypothetical protein